jgi:adenine deaminase
MEDHNILNLLEKDVCMTVVLNVLSYLGGYMAENFVAMNQTFSMRVSQVEKLIKNSIHGSFASDDRKRILLDQLNNWVLSQK